METKQRLHNAVAASASCLVSPGKEIKHVLGYNCELTYQPNKTFFQVEEKKKKEEANEDREKAGGANGQRDSIISRERRKEQVSSFFFLCEIIIVEFLQYSRMGHLDGNRGKINERESECGKQNRSTRGGKRGRVGEEKQGFWRVNWTRPWPGKLGKPRYNGWILVDS